jgi:chromosome segregation ATPase
MSARGGRMPVVLLLGLLSTRVDAKEGPVGSLVMAEKLAALRTEINDLDASLRSRRSLGSTELRGLQTRASELELAEDAERIKVEAIEAEVVTLSTSIAEHDQRSESLQSAVGTAIERLREVVESGLPYKKKERSAALNDIGRDLASTRTDGAAAAARVWRFIQDERRLASTVEQADVSLVLEDEQAPTLVRAVRVGTVALFVHAGSGRWGRVVRDAGGRFSYSEVRNRAQIAEIQRLFQSVEKQIREGRYRLPLFTSRVGR